MRMTVEKPAEGDLENMGVHGWPIWEKEVSTFPWEYDATEVCYLLDGKVTVTAEDGEQITFGKGDLVKFDKGLKCTWEIHEPVRKHYLFK